MDDKELKALWQSDLTSTKQVDENELAQILKRRSDGVLEKLQKIVRIEHYSNIIAAIFLVSSLLYFKVWLIASIVCIVMFIVIFYYKNLYNKVLNISYTENVLEHLQNIHSTLNDFKKRYIFGLIIIVPLSYYFGLEYGYFINSDDSSQTGTINNYNSNPESFFKPDNELYFILINLITLIVCVVIIYFIFHWLYGKKIKQIKNMIDTLKENEE